jgi:hypothetical protein
VREARSASTVVHPNVVVMREVFENPARAPALRSDHAQRYSGDPPLEDRMGERKTLRPRMGGSMASKLTFPVVGAQHAASLARDLLNVVREVNEWRHERDAFAAMHVDAARVERTRSAARDFSRG